MSFFARSYKIVGMRFFIGMRKHSVQVCANAPGNELFLYYAYFDFGYLNCQIK